MLLGSSRHRPVWVVVVSLLAAALLNILPVGLAGGYFQPDWVALVLIYWCLWDPERIGAGVGWGAGMLMDALDFGVLGRYALGKTVIAFIANRLSLRLRAYPMWQQCLGVGALVLLDTTVAEAVLYLLEREPGGLERWLTPLSSLLMWPLVVLTLRPSPRSRRYS